MFGAVYLQRNCLLRRSPDRLHLSEFTITHTNRSQPQSYSFGPSLPCAFYVLTKEKRLSKVYQTLQGVKFDENRLCICRSKGGGGGGGVIIRG